MNGSRLIIVSNRLPVTIIETPAGLDLNTAPGGMAAALLPVWRKYQALWVGWPGIGRLISRAEFETLHVGPNLALLNLDTDLYRRYYDVFSNGSMWPVLHGFEPRHVYEPEDYVAAREVNDRFARVLEQVARPDDVIWVHDFHLALLPGMIRARGMRNRLGYFLHVPFPQGEGFSKLPDHGEIARSMLEADVVGLQTEHDVNNLRVYAEAHGLGLPPKLAAFPVGIDFGQYSDGSGRAGVRRHLQEINRRYEGKKVIFSASRLDYTKGIMQQLRAVGELMAGGRRDVIYKVVVAPSREALSEYREVHEKAAEMVAEINGRGQGHVEYDYRNHSLDEMLAWYRRADVMLVTPLIDGMNLIAKEYVAAHGDDGMLVLGGRAGAAEQLSRAVLVDPYDADGMVRGLGEALDMSGAERAVRMQAMREVVRREDVYWWAERFMRALVE